METAKQPPAQKALSHAPQTSEDTSAPAWRDEARGMDYAAGTAMLAPIQMKGGGDHSADAHQAAALATSGQAGSLPHQATVQKAFGHHDISGIKAHTGSEAAAGTGALGAEAMAQGNSVAFDSPNPSLHTVAHESAHVIQQQSGVQLKGGVGEVGDSYEQHADAVADAVVSGKSAEGLLDQVATPGQTDAGGTHIQLLKKAKSPGRKYLNPKMKNSSNKVSVWEAQWTGNSDTYKLVYQLGEQELEALRPSKTEYEFTMPKRTIKGKRRLVKKVVWETPEKAYIYTTTGSDDAPADIFQFNLPRGGAPTEPYRLIKGGDSAADKSDRANPGLARRLRKDKDTDASTIASKKVFMSGMENANTLVDIANVVYSHIREHKSLKYSSSGQVKTDMLLTGSIDMAVCHATCEAFMHAVNATAAAKDIAGEATLQTDSAYLITNNSGDGLLGWPAGTTNITKKKTSTGTVPYTGSRIVFQSHTWVMVGGRVFDPVAGIKSGGASVVEADLAPGGDAWSGGGYKMTKNDDGPQGPLSVSWTMEETG